MSYRYFYHIKVEHGNGDPAEYLEQLRNEPMTRKMYRDILRWHLASDLDSRIVSWVRVHVYVCIGNFDTMPVLGDRRSWDPNLREWVRDVTDMSIEEMHLTARITWYPTFEDDNTRHIIKEYERFPYTWDSPFQNCGHRVFQHCECEVLCYE